MESSKFSFKLFNESPLNAEDLVPVFHSWIQTHAIPNHLLIDVADYAHVHDGPGVVLISHEANFSLDTRGGRQGLTYQRKQKIEGSFYDRLKICFDATKQAADLLTDRTKFRRDEIELRICDRLLAPNTTETFNAVKGDLLKLFPGAQLSHKPAESELFTVTIKPA